MRVWREQRGWNTRELAERVGTSRQNIENLEADAVDQPRYLPALAKLMGYATVEELIELKMPPDVVNVPAFIVSEERVHYDTPHSDQAPQAQSLSYPNIRIPGKPMRWGELMMLPELPDLFEVVLEDDAMAPVFPAGTVIKFRKGGDAKFGDRVLLQDRTGQFHFREYTQNFDGEPFEGLATGRGFRSILPRQHGATVVAVKAGHYVEGS